MLDTIKGYRVETPSGVVGALGANKNLPAMSKEVALKLMREEIKSSGLDESEFSLLEVVPSFGRIWIELFSGEVVEQKS